QPSRRERGEEDPLARRLDRRLDPSPLAALAMSLPAGRRFTGAFVALLSLGLAVAYGNSLHIGFLFDDTYGIVNNPAIRSLRNIPRFFTDPFTLTVARENVDLRPVLVVTFALNHAISSQAPWSYHLFNIALHFAAATLVFVIVRDHLWWPAED